MIALAKDRKIIMAAIYMPITKELYFASKGKGVFRNGKRIRCSNFKNFIDSNGVVGSIWSKRRAEMNKRLIKHLKDGSAWFSALGAVAVTSCMIADGRKDWIIMRRGGVWDYAAPSLIMSEAGCKVTNYHGRTWTLDDNEALAANPKLHKKMLKIIKGI
jgi:myo-inositol-1(or 4)-monophosphatase